MRPSKTLILPHKGYHRVQVVWIVHPHRLFRVVRRDYPNVPFAILKVGENVSYRAAGNPQGFASLFYLCDY